MPKNINLGIAHTITNVTKEQLALSICKIYHCLYIYTPLEHNFGIARIGCKDKNQMDNFIIKFSHLNVHQIDKFNFREENYETQSTKFGN